MELQKNIKLNVSKTAALLRYLCKKKENVS
jgi:hypothetical protein